MSGIHCSRQHIDAYLDGELKGAERELLGAHCIHCETCRSLLESRRALLLAVRSARPCVKAPLGLRERVSGILHDDLPELNKREPAGSMAPAAPERGWNGLMWPALVYSTLLLLLVGMGTSWFLARREARATRFVQMATQTHQRQLRGSLPIQMQSASAREITAWFGSKLPFSFRLPAYQDDAGDRSQYKIIGASLTSFEGKSAAYIAYQMRSELISLLVTSAEQAAASGGEITTAKSITFHSVQTGDLDVITWSVHHLTYALVSNVNLPRRQSCVVCHSDPKEHNLLHSALVHGSSFDQRRAAVSNYWSEQGPDQHVGLVWETVRLPNAE